MMHERRKSDIAIVALKPANKAEQSAAELVEPRAVTKGNADQQPTCRTLSRAAAKTAQVDVSQELARVRRAASRNGKEKFTALLHHVSTGLLEDAFFQVREDAAPGVDGLTWQEYEQNLEGRLADLHARIHRGTYRALPARRVFIPKPDGRQRPLAIAALEDKIVQRAVVEVLNAIYEDKAFGFCGFFREGSESSG